MKKKLYRRLPACLAICFLSAVLCPPVRAGGSWIVDGQAVQSLEVQTTNDDPAALHTDGSRKMTAPLVYESNVSSASTGLLRAYFPPEAGYIEILLVDEDEEVMRLSSSSNVGLMIGDLFISSSSVFNTSMGTKIAFEDQMFEGGWMIDSVLNNNYAVMNRSYADNRYLLKSAGITTTHTIQAGDVLQIQNGIIIAINP